jgi:hypothetical protein
VDGEGQPIEIGDDVADELGEELYSMVNKLITKACGRTAKQCLDSKVEGRVFSDFRISKAVVNTP